MLHGVLNIIKNKEKHVRKCRIKYFSKPQVLLRGRRGFLSLILTWPLRVSEFLASLTQSTISPSRRHIFVHMVHTFRAQFSLPAATTPVWFITRLLAINCVLSSLFSGCCSLGKLFQLVPSSPARTTLSRCLCYHSMVIKSPPRIAWRGVEFQPG